LYGFFLSFGYFWKAASKLFFKFAALIFLAVLFPVLGLYWLTTTSQAWERESKRIEIFNELEKKAF